MELNFDGTYIRRAIKNQEGIMIKMGKMPTSEAVSDEGDQAEIYRITIDTYEDNIS